MRNLTPYYNTYGMVNFCLTHKETLLIIIIISYPCTRKEDKFE